MFTLVKVRDALPLGRYADPGWCTNPHGTVAQKVSGDPAFGASARRGGPPISSVPAAELNQAVPPDHSRMHME